MRKKTRVGSIGIIGAGNLGQAFARTALRAGRTVVIANSRGPQSLAPVAASLGTGVSAGTIGEAAASAMVVIAVPWASVPAAAGGLVWNGKIVIDATNAFLFPDTPDMRPAALGGRLSSEIVAELVAGARVVKAANTLPAKLLGGDPSDAGGSRVLFLSGDNAAAKAEVAELLEAAGFFPRSISVTLLPGHACRRPREARLQASIWCGFHEWGPRQAGVGVRQVGDRADVRSSRIRPANERETSRNDGNGRATNAQVTGQIRASPLVPCVTPETSQGGDACRDATASPQQRRLPSC